VSQLLHYGDKNVFFRVRIYKNKIIFITNVQGKKDIKLKVIGSTEIWTRIAGFKVQCANHYTMEPVQNV
jgi:hypothetical protein